MPYFGTYRFTLAQSITPRELAAMQKLMRRLFSARAHMATAHCTGNLGSIAIRPVTITGKRS